MIMKNDCTVFLLSLYLLGYIFLEHLLSFSDGMSACLLPLVQSQKIK